MSDATRPFHPEDVHLGNPSLSLLCHSASINILITAQQYLSGVKRKPSVSVPSIICNVFRPLWGGGGGPGLLRGVSLKQSATFPENMAGIWLRGRWVSFRQGEGGMCFFVGGSVDGRRGGASEPVPTLPNWLRNVYVM